MPMEVQLWQQHFATIMLKDKQKLLDKLKMTASDDVVGDLLERVIAKFQKEGPDLQLLHNAWRVATCPIGQPTTCVADHNRRTLLAMLTKFQTLIQLEVMKSNGSGYPVKSHARSAKVELKSLIKAGVNPINPCVLHPDVPKLHTKAECRVQKKILGAKEKKNGSGSQSKPSRTKTGDSKLKAQKPKGNAAKANGADDMDIDSDSDNQSTPNSKKCLGEVELANGTVVPIKGIGDVSLVSPNCKLDAFKCSFRTDGVIQGGNY
ncbi:hypothetical protein BJ742DRAFT_741165 [Cladochytrium replicatum]|nr:hypothetical protein BJ742DRAFT_741165 [Cladochytrium replicatum]